MGIYINPPDLTAKTTFKKDFILKALANDPTRVKRATTPEFVAHTPGEDGFYGVVWVANGMFDALGVAFDKGEARAFSDTSGRPAMYFLVREDLIREWDQHAWTVLQKWTKKEAPVG